MDNNNSNYTLVNFRSSNAILEAFDRVCLLSESTRTQVLREMMSRHVSEAGPELANKASNSLALNERLKTAVEARLAKPMTEASREWSPALYDRLKSFSSPYFDPARS